MDFSGRSFSLSGLPGSFYKVLEDDKHQVLKSGACIILIIRLALH